MKGTENGVRKSGGTAGKRSLEESFKGKQKLIKKVHGATGTRNYNSMIKGSAVGE